MFRHEPVLFGAAQHGCVVHLTCASRIELLLEGLVGGTKYIHAIILVGKVVSVLLIGLLQPFNFLLLVARFGLLLPNLVLKASECSLLFCVLAGFGFLDFLQSCSMLLRLV